MEYKAFVETEISDHDFAKWLRKHGGNWDCKTNFTPRANHYFCENGTRIAYAIFDNEKMTRRVFLMNTGEKQSLLVCPNCGKERKISFQKGKYQNIYKCECLHCGRIDRETKDN